MNPSLGRSKRFFSVSFSFIGACLLACVLSSRTAFAQDSFAIEDTQNTFAPEVTFPVEVNRNSRQQKNIEEMDWKKGSIKLVTQSFGKRVEAFYRIEGFLSGKQNPTEWYIIWNKNDAKIDEKGEFRLEVPFDYNMKVLELIAVGPNGEVEYHFYDLKLDEALTASTKKSVEESKDESPYLVGLGLGVSKIDFTQKCAAGLTCSTGSEVNYNATALTLKGSFSYMLVPATWDLGVSGYINVKTLSKSSNDDLRFMGVNLRAGYIFPQIQAPWRLSLYFGGYFASVNSSNQLFGYSSVTGPQIYPSLRRTLSNGHSVSSYLKFSPISTGFGIPNLSNNEIAIGAGYLVPVGKRTYSISVDYARLGFTYANTEFKNNSISLSGGVSF